MKFLISILLIGLLHDFHTSITEINYNSKEGSLEVSLRLFTDDLEATLTKLNKGVSVKIEDDSKKVNPLLEQYIKKNFALISENKEVKFGDFYGKEKEADATWVYLEFTDCKNLNKFTLYNALLVDMFNDQTNIVNITHSGRKKTLIYKESHKTEMWPF